MVPLSFGCGSAVLAAMAILAPSRAAFSAMARPMPREAPVMNSVLPFRLMRSGHPVVVGGAALGEGRERLARLGRFQLFEEMSAFELDPRGQRRRVAHQGLGLGDG